MPAGAQPGGKRKGAPACLAEKWGIKMLSSQGGSGAHVKRPRAMPAAAQPPSHMLRAPCCNALAVDACAVHAPVRPCQAYGQQRGSKDDPAHYNSHARHRATAAAAPPLLHFRTYKRRGAAFHCMCCSPKARTASMCHPDPKQRLCVCSWACMCVRTQEGLHFDVDGRVGVVFNISDRYMLGSLSMLTVGVAPHEMYASMQQVLTFIANKERETEQANSMAGRR